jgi:hypothetical protein
MIPRWAPMVRLERDISTKQTLAGTVGNSSPFFYLINHRDVLLCPDRLKFLDMSVNVFFRVFL